MKASGFAARWREQVVRILDSPGPSRRAQLLMIGAVLVLCACVRIATIGNPPIDRTAWKEMDYVMISRGYQENGFWLPRPTLTWPAEDPRFTEMELPLVPYTTAALEEAFGERPLVVRAVPLLAWLLLALYVFRLARRELGVWTGLAAGTAAAIIPLSHPFGRLLLSEPAMIAASTAAIYHLAEWMGRGRRRDAALFGVLLAIAIGLKIEALWVMLPVAFVIARSGRRTWRTLRGPVAVVAAALVVPVVWYAWAAHLERTGVHAFGLFEGHDKYQTIEMLTSTSWWRTMAFRLRTDLLGNVAGVAIAAFGVVTALVVRRRAALFLVIAAGAAAHMVIIAEGALDAPYRQLNLVPTLAVFMALGAVGSVAAFHALPAVSRSTVAAPLALAGALGLLLVPLVGRVDEVRGSADPVSPDRWALAATIRTVAGPDDRLAVVGEYDPKVGANDISPVLLYYSKLRGWNVPDAECSLERVQALAARGAAYLVVVKPFNRSSLAPCGGEPEGSYGSITAVYPTVYSSPELLLVELKAPT